MIWENIQLAFSALISNKMRALLTMLGIIIGISSIITIVIVGDALSASVTEDLSALGGGNLTANVQERGIPNREMGGGGMMIPGLGAATARPAGGAARPGGGGSAALTGRTPLPEDLITDQMIANMLDYFQGDVVGVSLSHSVGNAEVRDLDLSADVSVSGVNREYFLANNVTLLAGRFLNETDLEERSNTVVVSNILVESMLEPGTDPIGQQVRLFLPNEIQIFTIVGVYSFEQNPMMAGFAAALRTPFYIPLTTARLGTLERNYSTMTIMGAPGVDIPELTASLQSYFDNVYSHNQFWRINIVNMASLLDTITDTLGTIQLAIAFIAGISLLVGGIGVMNIMLVSVTERTREIGTRKALGAKNFHIRIQFVIESLIVALCGGIIGMILGVVLGGTIAWAFEAPLIVSPAVVVGSMMFAMVIGVFFGIYPANRAAKLDPIEALRYE